jgi:hypothetical protein
LAAAARIHLREENEERSPAVSRFNAEEKLRRGQPVTIAEIVETYCQLVRTDRGRVPVPETVPLLKRKAAEAAERGLLRTE